MNFATKKATLSITTFRNSLIGLSCVFLLACDSTQTSRAAAPTIESHGFESLVDLHNLARTDAKYFDGKACKNNRGTTPQLNWNVKLAKTAQDHAQWMRKREKLSHGKALSKPVKAENYRFSALAENIAKANLSDQKLFALWLKSTAHCKNILSPKYSDVGIGKDGDYWAVVFAKPA